MNNELSGLLELSSAELILIDGGKLRLSFEHGFWIGFITTLVLIALL